MENSCNKDFYKTKDLAEAAFLYASHKIFSKLEKKIIFIGFALKIMPVALSLLIFFGEERLE